MRCRELQVLTENLELKVAERTRDLEMRNRALAVALMVTNGLPVGVLGIDSEGTIVYLNTSLRRFINISNLMLGEPAQSKIHNEILASINQTIIDNDCR